MNPKLKMFTTWHYERYRKGELISKQKIKNVVPTEGLNATLDIMLDAGTQITSWYIAPFESDTTPATTTTYATPVFTEATLYDEATRGLFDPSAASGGVLSSVGSKASFTWSTTKTIYGAALVGGGAAASTKGDTAGGGTVFSAARFAASDEVEDDDISKIYLEVTLANA